MRSARGRRRAIIWGVVGVTLLAIVGGLAFYRPFASRNRGIAAGSSIADVPPPPPLPVKRTTFLVMGVDQRPDDTGRSDSMMVVSYDDETKQLAAVSLPRDTWTLIPGHGYDKLNHSFAFGGEQLAMRSTESLLGIPIDHYVTVTFQDFAKIVDAVGGIDVDAEKRMYYVDPFDTGMGPQGLVIDIQPGPQHMDGLTALKYSRFRHDDEADMGRIRRQQQVAKSLMKAAARPAIITRLSQLIPALSSAINTDMSVADMVRYGLRAKDAMANPLKTGVFAGDDKIMGGIYYFVADLLKDREQSYKTLVGTDPPEEFLARARKDAETYARALAAETGESFGQTATSAEAVGQAGDGGQSTQPGQGAQTGQTGANGQSGTNGQTGQNGQNGQPGQGAPAKQLTIALIDATGKGLAGDYISELLAAGFRVARVAKAATPVAQTAAIDHAGQPGTADRVHAVLPGALMVTQPDSSAEEAVEIVLGQDLVPGAPKTP